jgi:hypothetical protein
VGEAVVLLEFLAALLLVPVAYLLLGRRARRRRIGGSLLAPLEEIWDPRAHATHVEIHVHADRRDPAPAPGDPLRER